MNFNSFCKKIISIGIVASIGFGAMATLEPPVMEAASATSASKGQQIIDYGKTYMGTPYDFGATSASTKKFDCSSFTQHIFGHYGVNLPRSSVQQSREGNSVSRSDLQTGDLIFFSSGSRANGRNVTHVAVYAGGGKILHTYGSPGVTISDLNSGNWDRTYLFARRVL